MIYLITKSKEEESARGSLSLVIVDLVTEEVIKVKKIKMHRNCNIVCYADAVLMAENEIGPQRMLFQLNKLRHKCENSRGEN